jgi:signal transduction histidine kinase
MCGATTVAYVGIPGFADRAAALDAAGEGLTVDPVEDPDRLPAALDGTDCVVLEHGEGLDGPATLRAIRERDPAVPVVLFPQSGSEALAAEAVAAGATAYAPREEGVDGLADRVSDAVARARADRRRRREADRRTERIERFASLLSHDLRNPLNVAMGRLRIVAEDCDHDQLPVVEQSLDRIETLVGDVVALVRLGEPVDGTETAAVDPGRIAAGYWRTVDTGNATLQVDTDRPVEAEHDRLRRLFEELLDNGRIHGGGAVEVGEFEAGFYVADDGPGFPDAEAEQLLEPGFAAGEAGGEGFGLAIAAEVAAAHGWDLRLGESEAGGARVEVATDTGRPESVDTR